MNICNISKLLQVLAWIQVVSSVTQTFSYTGSVQTFVVPQTVNSINMEVIGGQGGGNFFGAIIIANVPVTAGDTLYVYVGGAGSCTDQSGGFNGGGKGTLAMFNTVGCGGGGGSDVRTDQYDLSTRLIAAGGSGGDVFSTEWGNSDAGDGGCPDGFSGEGTSAASGSYGGGGGNQTHGGVGGFYSTDYKSGVPGSAGSGGDAGSDTSGGGGGGGYYGGGGGASTGGGGGSSYSPYSYSCGVYSSDDALAQDGKIIFTYSMEYTLTYDYSGSSETFYSPSDVSEVTVNVSGAAGSSSTMGLGGLGGFVSATLNTTYNTPYYVKVGGSSGYNGGGAAGCETAGSGGGASTISTSDNTLLVIAGGGGGAGFDGACTTCTASETGDNISGGSGGATDGAQGNKDPVADNSSGGVGGTQSAGGTGGTYESEPAGSGGSSLTGGAAGAGTCGGGGGAGFFGGGGGANTGGGGGSNYAAVESVSTMIDSQGANSGNGIVTITFRSTVYVEPVATDDNTDDDRSKQLSMGAVLGIFFALLFTALICGAVINKRTEAANPPRPPAPSGSANPMH